MQYILSFFEWKFSTIVFSVVNGDFHAWEVSSSMGMFSYLSCSFLGAVPTMQESRVDSINAYLNKFCFSTQAHSIEKVTLGQQNMILIIARSNIL